jgi:hypothetical protein
MYPRSFFPSALSSLYTDAGLHNRMRFNNMIRKMIKQHRNRTDLSSYERQYLHSLLADMDNVIVPNANFIAASECFDIIGVCVWHMDSDGNASNSLFQEEYGPDSPIRLGMGKTALALHLVGVNIPYADIPSPPFRTDPEGIRAAIQQLSHRDLMSIPREESRTQLVATDLVYLSSRGGRLVVAPVVSEPFVAQWDIARHIARYYDVYY